jgi:hypothetical protein
MATAHFSTYPQGESHTQPLADGFCVTSAMSGGAFGALAGVAMIGSTFEYAAVLVGTLGVVLGSVIAGTAGRYVLYPAFKAFQRL